jgi:hypothetical protein
MTNILDPEIQRILEDHYYDAERTYNKYQDALKQAALNQMALTWTSPPESPSQKQTNQSGLIQTNRILTRSLRVSVKILKALYKCSWEIALAFQDEGIPPRYLF